MIGEASFGFMIWDGRSKGTLYNLVHLVEAGKKALLYVSPEKSFATLMSFGDVQSILAKCEPETIAALRKVIDLPLLQGVLDREDGITGIAKSDGPKQLVLDGLF